MPLYSYKLLTSFVCKLHSLIKQKSTSDIPKLNKGPPKLIKSATMSYKLSGVFVSFNGEVMIVIVRGMAVGQCTRRGACDGMVPRERYGAPSAAVWRRTLSCYGASGAATRASVRAVFSDTIFTVTLISANDFHLFRNPTGNNTVTLCHARY